MNGIVFVHPPRSFKKIYGDLANTGSELPPQGLCYLAAVTREAGYDTSIVDCIAEGLNLDQTVKKILKYSPKYVGFSVYTIMVDIVAKIVHKLKEINKDITIIVGGGHLAMEPEETLKKYKQFDIGVYGEGEKTIIDLLDTLEKKKNLSKVQGIVFRKRKKIIKTKLGNFIKNLDTLPLPAWDLLPKLDKYYIPAADSIHRLPSAGIITSRGCPAHCFFCNNSTFGHNVRTHSPKYIIKMIKDLIKRYGIKDVYLQDDTFTYDKKHVIDFCKELIKENLDITWSCHGRVNYIDPEMLRWMKKTKCWQISYGIESLSQEVLDAMNKGTTVKQNLNAVKWTREAGIRIKGFFMLGNFKETKESMKKTLHFIKSSLIDDFRMTYFTPLPATVCWKIASRYGKVLTKEWVELDQFNPNFIPNGLTKKELTRYYKKIYFNFYLKPKTILHYLRKLMKKSCRKKIIYGFFAFLKLYLRKH